MSMSKQLGLVGSSNQDSHEEIKNNNKCTGNLWNGDANANEIEREHGRILEDSGTQSSFVSHIEEHDKIIIWGTDSQYDDPELAEFEMLECQELEAYLVESEDSNVKGERVIPGNLANNTVQTKADAPKHPNYEASQLDKKEQKTSHKSISREAEASTSKAENSSDNDVFVTCHSTMSSLASQSCMTISDKSKSSPHTEGCQSVDFNLNTTTLIEEPVSEAQQIQTAKSIKTLGQQKNDVNECNLSFTDTKVEHNDKENASEDNAGHHENATEEQPLLIRQDCKVPNAQTIQSQQTSCQPFGSDDTSVSVTDKIPDDFIQELKGKQSQREETQNETNKSSESGATEAQCVVIEPRMYQKQASFERTRSASPSSLERRMSRLSSSRPATPPFSKTTSSPKRRPASSSDKSYSTETPSPDPSGSPQRFISGLKPPSKSYFSSGIPKPIPPQQPSMTEFEPMKPSSPQRPKNVRPKIITYVRKNPQVKPNSADSSYEASTLPSRPTPWGTTSPKDQKVVGSRASPGQNSSNIPYDKYRQEMHKSGYNCPAGLMVSGIKPPSHTVSHKMVGKSESFHGELPDKYLQEVGRGLKVGAHDVAGVYRSPRALRPQLGLGAVTRQPTTKTRVLMSGQRSTSPLSHLAPMGQPDSCYQESTAGDSRKPLLEVAPKSLLPKSGQSGLRPPGFTHLPTARLAAFGFVRSASVTSVSSNQSSNSSHSSPCRLPNAARKEFQRDGDPHPPVSSPKRFAVVSPKPQSPVRQKSCVARLGDRVQGADAERERLAVQGLRERCEKQAKQIISLQAQLGKTLICMDVLAITTQNFCQKSDSGVLKERQLSLELSRIRDEVVDSVGRFEHLLGEKAELEHSFEQQLRDLKEKQEKELQDLQDRLRDDQQKETKRLQQKQSCRLEQLRSHHQQQVEEMNENHDAAMQEMEATHNATLATLQEEHARTVKNLKMAHEQQKKSLEEEFEKIRLSLQDQVDTLTFQNRSLRDRAKRFEEALRRSTDEQIVEALAPYQHIEEDLKSLKEVLEMKNQQIHQQELKITELEKLAQKNALLEERVQVLQQQNEDLKVRIDLNLAMSRQLSEENANLHENVEKESNEKKRLSRTNEELLWRLQTGELSPRMSPNQSPLHRPSSGPGSPSHFPPFPR